MLCINNLTVKDAVFDNIIIDDLSFVVNDGDKIAVIGSEGTGKSTLLKLIAGRDLGYVDYHGEIIVNSSVYYLEQNIEYLWKDKTVEHYLYHDSLFLNEMIAEAKILFNHMSLDYFEFLDRHIGSLSGGEKVKIGLVKALLKHPDVLLLDEPSNDLDFESITFLEEFLIGFEKCVVFISHDQRLLENVANGIVHLQHVHKQTLAKSYFYRIGYLEYKDRYFRKIKSDLQIARKERTDYKIKMEKFRKIYQKVEYQQNQAVRNPQLARLLKKKIHSLKSQEKRYEKEKQNWTELPEVEEPMNIFFDQKIRINPNKLLLDLKISNFKLLNNKVIKEISFTLTADEKVVIVGRNGVGKTTFLKEILLHLDNKSIKYGYIPQDYLEVLDKNLSVIDFLIINQDKYVEYRLRQILGQLGFKKDEMNELIGNISEGQKLKVLLLLMVSKDIELIVLDEPTRNISPINQDEIYNLFLDYSGAIVAVTHDREFIESVFDKMYELTPSGLI